MDNNYTLGRGELYFGQFAPGTQTPQGELYFGNTPELAFAAEQETLDHYNSDEGIRQKDESVILQQDYMGNFITDNISPENLALFFLGESSTITDAGSTVTDEEHDSVAPGRTYQLGTSAAMPAGVRKVSAVTVTDDAGTPQTFTVTDDYTVDLDLGRVYIVPGGAITQGTNLLISYTVDASSRSKIVSKGKAIEGALRYISKNPAGDNIDYFMPYVKVYPNGDFTLKGDEWQQLPFNIEILKKGTLEAVYMDGRPLVS